MRKLIGKILCAMGLHDAKFSKGTRYCIRPHFYCQRREENGCNYTEV